MNWRSVMPAAVTAAFLVVVAGVAVIRGGPVASPSSSPSISVPVPGTSAAPFECGLPSYLALARHGTGSSLVTSLETVQPAGLQTDEVLWVVRFLLDRGAPGAATIEVMMEVRVLSPAAGALPVVGYEEFEPERRVLKEGEALTLSPCKALTVQIRTAGPIRDGQNTYDIAIHKLGLPEGGVIEEHLTVDLSCSSRTATCDRVPGGIRRSPAPTADAALLKPSFGIIYSGVRAGSSLQVRREGETKIAVAELAPSYYNEWNGAVAPDGRRAAYFAQTGSEPWTLFMFDGARNQQRALLTLPGEVPFQPVWSADGLGVAFTVIDQMGSGATPAYSAIRTLDLGSGAVTERARISDGSTYTLVGWDRASGTLAATIVPHASQPTTYLVLSGNRQRTWAFDGFYSAIASPDARDVVGIKCEGIEIGCSLWTWKLADFDSRADRQLGNALSLAIIGWRPGTNEIGLAVSSIKPPAGLITIALWSTSGGPLNVVYGPSASSGPGSFFRADGTALVVVPAPDAAVLVDLIAGRTTPLPLPPPDGGLEFARPTASIRLGP
ncbi:MAG TPA: hypothetical protein VEN31_03160 [Candidatus Bathyarchaeia archaeon]|nr:hypothetical protein [Candidatus Bathyarchaeia archaeon]